MHLIFIQLMNLDHIPTFKCIMLTLLKNNVIYIATNFHLAGGLKSRSRAYS